MGRQPIDQGYSWVACVGTGIYSYFVVGGLKSMGILFVEIIEMFDVPRSVTALPLGLLAGGFAVCAMMTNAACVMFGFRPVIMLGSFLFVMSIFMAQFPINITFLIIFLGLFKGISLAVMFTPAVHLLSLYFDKKRSFANGISFAGSSIGQLTLPYLLTYLIEEYGYRGAMLIYSAITMHTFAAALLLRPITFWGKDRKKKKIIEPLDDPTEHAVVPLVEDLKQKARSTSFHSVHSSDDEQHIKHVRPSYRSLDPLPPAVRSRCNTLTLTPGPSVESLAMVEKEPDDDDDDDDVSERKSRKVLCLDYTPITCIEFCKLLFDPDLIKSPSLWIIFMALGLGHAGFINVLLHLPVLSVELFNDKYTGALLLAIAGCTDIIGRIGGGWFADQGYITRVKLTATCFAITGGSTLLATIHPVFSMLVVLCLIMGLVGGIYRVLLPVIVGDVFGPTKLGPGIGMLFMALGVLAVPIPSLLGYMKNELLSYIPAFQLCGALLVFGSGLLFMLPLVRNCDPAVVKSDKPESITAEKGEERV